MEQFAGHVYNFHNVNSGGIFVHLTYAIGVILLLCSAMWIGAKGKEDWLTAAFLSVPLIAAFGFLVLPKMPVLWPHLLFWFITATIGLHSLTPMMKTFGARFTAST